MSGNYRNPPPPNIPIPDPSTITAQEIAKAKAEVREEFRLMVTGLRDVIDTRLNGMDKATVVLETNLNRVPTLLDREASRLETLLEGKITNIQTKFNAIDERFRERDVRFDQDKASVATAIAAALQAQKDAAAAQNQNIAATFAKSEISFTKEIDSLKVLINATKSAATTDIANLTGRLDRGEGGYQGARMQTEDSRANLTQIITIISGIVGFFVLLVMIGGLWVNSHASHSDATPNAIAVAPLNKSALAPP
jgi:hypothetical protein